jgi:hypothetical protein
MCKVNIFYCLVCKKLLHRSLQLCRYAHDRFICVDEYTYNDKKPIIAMDRDGALSLDLTKIVRQDKRDTTCDRCDEIGVENVFRERRHTEHQRQTYTETGYYSGND